MMKKIAFPCPCGGKLKWKKEQVVRDEIDCGILDTEVCEKCGDVYLPSASMRIVEQKLKAAGLWGMKREKIRFWKSGGSVSTRFPIDFAKKTGLDNVKEGWVVREGEHKIIIEF